MFFYVLISLVFIGCGGNLPSNNSCDTLSLTINMGVNCDFSYETKKAFMHYYVDKCFAGEKVTLKSSWICGQMEEFERGLR